MAGTTTFIDFDPFGQITPQGEMVVHFGHEAIEASMRLFLASFKGEFIRNPDKGGYLIRLLNKPMDERIAQEIREQLTYSIAQDFSPTINISKLTVVPLYEEDRWQIDIQGYCPLVKEEISLSEKFKHMII